jgi:phage terminase small subunit
MGSSKELIALQEDPGAEHGSALAELTAKQRKFVAALIDAGDRNYAEAARRAGYSGGGKDASIRTIGSQLIRNPKIVAAFKQLTRSRMDAGCGMAFSELEKLAENGINENVRLRAAMAILNRAGFHEKTEHTVNTFARDIDFADRLRAVAEIAKANGWDLPSDAKYILDNIDAAKGGAQPLTIEPEEDDDPLIRELKGL